MSRKIGIATSALLFLVSAPFAAHADEQATFNRCWGAATKAAIELRGGEAFGEHASGESVPRVGLANLAVQLFGETGDPGSGGMGRLGAFVAEEWELHPEECELP